MPGESLSKEAFEAKYNCKLTVTRNHEGNYLPCPFCGKTELNVEPLQSAWGDDIAEDHVICNNCAASAPVESWQQRKLD